MISDTIRVALLVAEALERCRLRYLVGGSLASAVSGEPRSTIDVDMVIELTESDVAPLSAALGDRFHVDADALLRAVRERSSTNIFHVETSTKVDLFVVVPSALHDRPMDRRQRVQVATDPAAWLYFYTPEDILLQKLRWYRMGNESSDRQWRDVVGIILVQSDRLDVAYLEHTAETLGLSDLLQRALRQVRGE